MGKLPDKCFNPRRDLKLLNIFSSIPSRSARMSLAKIRINDKNHGKIGRIGPPDPIVPLRLLNMDFEKPFQIYIWA